VPIERPTQCPLSVNRKTAKALRMAIPEPILDREERMRVLTLVMMIVASTLSHALEVVVSAEVQTPPRPTIHGSSNLPDGTKLAVIVTRQESAYRAEALTEMKSGRFVIGPLSQRGNDLNPGVYNLEVSMASTTDQPLAVREMVGRQGEKLLGPLTKRDGRSRTVRYATTFQVGVGVNAELDRAARERAKMSQTRWWKKQCTEICENAEGYELGKGNAFSSPDCLKTCISNPPILTR